MSEQENARIEAMFKAGFITEDVKYLLQGKNPAEAKRQSLRDELDELFRPLTDALEKTKRGGG